MKRGRSAVVWRSREPSWAYVDSFPPTDSVSRVQPACEWECIHSTRRICYFLQKWWNDLSSGFASNFARSLETAKWKPFGKFSVFLATTLWSSHILRSGIIDSKMAASQWRAKLVPVGPQQAEMTSSLTKRGLWSCKTCGGVDKNWFGTFHFERWFGHAGTWQLHHDNAPAHSLQLIQTFLAKYNISVVRQASHSPDMGPCEFWLFPTWKRSKKELDLSHKTTLYGPRQSSCSPFAKVL
jgi:hypothetical protein